jgi:hypothetical protein
MTVEAARAAELGKGKAPSPYGVAMFCDEIVRLTRRHHRATEEYCNTGDPDGIEPIERKIRELISGFWGDNVTAKFSGDPRGATVKLQVPSGKTNDWNESGICVPSK